MNQGTSQERPSSDIRQSLMWYQGTRQKPIEELNVLLLSNFMHVFMHVFTYLLVQCQTLLPIIYHMTTHTYGIPNYEDVWKIQPVCPEGEKKQVLVSNDSVSFYSLKKSFHSFSHTEKLLILSPSEVIQGHIQPLNLAQSPGSPGSHLLWPSQVLSGLASGEQLHRFSYSDGPLQLI